MGGLTVDWLAGIHLGKEGWGLQVPSLHTYSEGGEYSNLNPLRQEIEHCIVVGVLWQVATPLLGSAGLIHFPSGLSQNVPLQPGAQEQTLG